MEHDRTALFNELAGNILSCLTDGLSCVLSAVLVELTLGELSGIKLLGEFVHSRVVLVWNLVLLDDVLCRNLSVVWNSYERDWSNVSVFALLL